MQFKKIIVSSDNMATKPWPGSKLKRLIHSVVSHVWFKIHSTIQASNIFQVQCGAASPIPAFIPMKATRENLGQKLRLCGYDARLILPHDRTTFVDMASQQQIQNCY